MKKLQLPESSSYTFADYFRLGIPADQIADYFGYKFVRAYQQWLRSTMPLTRIEDLRLRLYNNTLHTSLTSEIARREFLIAPILTEVIIYTQSNVQVEFPLIVTDKLKGSLDYLVQGNSYLLIIEAKNSDLEQGFTQLAVGLIALDQWVEDATATIYGAVTIGSIWQFGLLARQEKCITQDMNLFRVPADVGELLEIILAIVQD